MVFSKDVSVGARRLRIGTALALVVVVGICLYAAIAGLAGLGQPGEVHISSASDSGTPANRNELIAAAIAGLPLAIALWRLIRMLRAIERGQLFTGTTVAELRGFALFVMISALASILVLPVLDIATALASDADTRTVTLTFDGGDFFALLVSVLLFFLARLLGEAQRIAEDNEQIV
ncbi:DUF2975 domain-containing protein [Pedomonas sp. V897]|uniref:DUF2975 domain-containing protein n=1 Tax=Pedomonas sp. V897 TaxID=3446482 RepID=UPI003EE25AA5